jgi:hypothetical protein
MIYTILGIFLLFSPFLSIFFFEDKKKGFVYVLFFVLLFQLVLGFFTQLSGVFYYWVVLAVNFFAVFILLFLFLINKNKLQVSSFKFQIREIDWILLAVIIIAFLNLYQVHFNYTGKINLATDQVVSYHEVKNMKYIYPYFSDEWYAVSLVKGAIEHHSLPVRNIFNNGYFVNLEVFFHSFLAEIFLLLNLNVLTNYVLISIFFNILIVILAYLFLRLNNISEIISGIISLSITYIACGANLPGIWNLLPITLGVIFSLICFCFMTFDNFKMAVLSSVLVLLFYPPFIFFSLLGLLVFFIEKFKANRKAMAGMLYAFFGIIFLAPVIYVLLMISPLDYVTNFIVSKLYYPSFFGQNMPQYYFYYIIPLPIIFLAFWGIKFIFKNKKWLFFQFLLGIFLWLLYSFIIARFVIEFDKAVFYTTLLAVLISGFGLQSLLDYLWMKLKISFEKYLGAGALCLFLALIPFYTHSENWKNFVLINPATSTVSYPKSPANNYLTQDDLRIFSDLREKVFLSLPWKGTVLGVATKNYPVVTKEGNISMGQEIMVRDFIEADCKTKNQLAEDLKIDYVYLYDFDCPNFKKINKSEENLLLYEFGN